MSVISDSKITNNDSNLQNVISIENFDRANQNGRQRSKKKGKLYLGSNFNAYNRENLGSIPRKTENVLIRDKNNPVKLGFASNTARFEQKAQKVKYNFPGPGSYMDKSNLDTTANSLNTTSRSSKGFGTGFVSKTSRFAADDVKEFYDQYLPCPTQYKKDRVLSMDASITNSTLFKSMYNKNETKSLKPVIQHPGPGFYNPQKNEPIIDTTKNTFYFKSEIDRFGKERDTEKVGPGSYFNNENHFHDKFFAKPSYFFADETKQPEPLIEKYLDVKKANPKYLIPGPGSYYPETYLNLDTKYLQEQENSKHKRSISTGDAIRNKTKVPICSQDFYETKSGLYNVQKGISSPFMSKTSHDTKFIKKVVPGPAFYNPNNIPDKLSFNCNVEKKFI